MEGHEGEGWVCEREGEDGKMGPQMGAWLVLVGYVGRPACSVGGDGGTRSASRVCRVSVAPRRAVRCTSGRSGPPPSHVVATWLASSESGVVVVVAGLVSRSVNRQTIGAEGDHRRRRQRANRCWRSPRRVIELVAGLPPAAAGVEHPSLGRRRYR